MRFSMKKHPVVFRVIKKTAKEGGGGRLCGKSD